MLKKLSPQQSLASARNAAIEALLMCDTDADRKLDRSEFQTLIDRYSLCVAESLPTVGLFSAC